MARVAIPTFPNPAIDLTSDPETVAYVPSRGRPFLFQVLAPGTDTPMYPFALALHVNPSSLSEKMQKSKNVVMTYGGFVEFVWPDELDTISADSSTGGFISPNVGLTAGGDSSSATKTSPVVSAGRKGTIAWERQQDLLELFHNNGMVYNGMGEPVLRGRIMMMYDRGLFTGHFTSFQVDEDDEHAFSFKLNWEFRIEATIYRFPSSIFSSSGSQ